VSRSRSYRTASLFVLNAFRHHGVSRSEQHPRLCSKCGRVLNAFRHHGVSRPDVLRGLPGPLEVLNAFRHHGVSRSMAYSYST